MRQEISQHPTKKPAAIRDSAGAPHTLRGAFIFGKSFAVFQRAVVKGLHFTGQYLTKRGGTRNIMYDSK